MADRPPNFPGEQGPGIDHTLPPVNAAPPVVETSPAPQDSADSEKLRDADISNKTFRFNPPLHASNMTLLPNVGGSKNLVDKWNDEERDSPTGDYTEKWAEKGLGTLRLGRIIQHYLAPGRAGLLKHRWGFRFLYNPTTVTYASSRNDTFIIDPRSETNRVMSGVFQNFQTVSFTVLLDRTPDIMSGIEDENQYSPRLRGGDRAGLLRYGTHWDLEALLKICNGEWDLTDRGKTSNIGTLMPSNARLILGPGVNFFGFVSSVTWKDEMFSPNMVPMRTRVDIQFKRHVDMTAEEAVKAFPGIASTEESTPDSGGGGGGVDDGPADTGTLPSGTGRKPTYPINFSNSSGTSHYGHMIHAAICANYSWMDRKGAFGDYGAGKSNHGTGRALDIFQSVSPKNSSNRGWEVAYFLKKHASALFVTQIIFQQKIWTTERSGEGWRPMSNRGSDTANHYDHVHVSFGPGSGSNDQSKKLSLSTSEAYWRNR